jgi:hypothetical protein
MPGVGSAILREVQDHGPALSGVWSRCGDVDGVGELFVVVAMNPVDPAAS